MKRIGFVRRLMTIFVIGLAAASISQEKVHAQFYGYGNPGMSGAGGYAYPGLNGNAYARLYGYGYPGMYGLGLGYPAMYGFGSPGLYGMGFPGLNMMGMGSPGMYGMGMGYGYPGMYGFGFPMYGLGWGGFGWGYNPFYANMMYSNMLYAGMMYANLAYEVNGYPYGMIAGPNTDPAVFWGRPYMNPLLGAMFSPLSMQASALVQYPQSASGQPSASSVQAKSGARSIPRRSTQSTPTNPPTSTTAKPTEAKSE